MRNEEKQTQMHSTKKSRLLSLRTFSRPKKKTLPFIGCPIYNDKNDAPSCPPLTTLPSTVFVDRVKLNTLYQSSR